MSMDLSAPLVLLATIWVSAAPVLTVLKMLHEQRDIVFRIREIVGMEPDRAYRVRRAAFLHSYLPMLLGTVIFLALMTGFILFAARYVSLPAGQEEYRWTCYLVGLMPGSMLLGFAYGGTKDVVEMLTMLREDQPRAAHLAGSDLAGSICNTDY